MFILCKVIFMTKCYIYSVTTPLLSICDRSEARIVKSLNVTKQNVNPSKSKLVNATEMWIIIFAVFSQASCYVLTIKPCDNSFSRLHLFTQWFLLQGFFLSHSPNPSCWRACSFANCCKGISNRIKMSGCPSRMPKECGSALQQMGDKHLRAAKPAVLWLAEIAL